MSRDELKIFDFFICCLYILQNIRETEQKDLKVKLLTEMVHVIIKLVPLSDNVKVYKQCLLHLVNSSDFGALFFLILCNLRTQNKGSQYLKPLFIEQIIKFCSRKNYQLFYKRYEIMWWEIFGQVLIFTGNLGNHKNRSQPNLNADILHIIFILFNLKTHK